MSHIFISYNQSDADFAAVLSIYIEKAGVDTWMDKSRLRPGQDWSVEIDEAIINSHALVVIMSPEAKSSEYVTYEWSFALGAGVQVIPILYKETILHPRLGRLHYLKFTDTTVRPWDLLLETVKAAVNQSGVYAVRIPRDAPPHVKSAIVALDSANAADREGAVSVLANTDHPTAKEALLSALRHPLRSVRWDAALHVSDDERVVSALTDVLLSEKAPLEKLLSTAEHLAGFGVAGMNALLELMSRPEVHINILSRGLGLYEGGEAIPNLIRLLHDTDPEHRHRAALALGSQPIDLIAPAIAHALQDTDMRVRHAAIASGQRYYERVPENLWEVLLAGIKDASADVRHAASRYKYNEAPEIVRRKLVEMARTEPAHIALVVHMALMHAYKQDDLVELSLLENVGQKHLPGTILKGRPEAGHNLTDTDYYVLTRIEGGTYQVRNIKVEDDRVKIVDSKVAEESLLPDFLLGYFATNLSVEVSPDVNGAQS